MHDLLTATGPRTIDCVVSEQTLHHRRSRLHDIRIATVGFPERSCIAEKRPHLHPLGQTLRHRRQDGEESQEKYK